MMKKNKHYYILLWAISTILLVLLLIQVNWIFRAAKMEEKLFSKKVEMALIETRHDIADSKLLCDSMKYCVRTFQCSNYLKKKKLAEVDSLIQKNLNTYHLHLDYEFEIEDVKLGSRPRTHNCYMQSLEGILKEDGISLRINFPGRNQFILRQIGGMFVLSVVIIIALLIIFWTIIRSYIKQKKLAERTRDFINNMTHEFKTPLANIGFANNLLGKSKEVEESEKLVNYTQIIESEKNKLRGNVEEILNIAHFERNGKHCSNFEKNDLNDIVSEAIKAVFFHIEERKGDIDQELSLQLPTINSNKKHLVNAIINILDNSIKYSIDPPKIMIKTYEDKNNVVVSIKDKGIGIKDTDLKHIFEKYYRVSTGDVHNVKGFGIGLTYVKKVVVEHHGDINIESKIDEGTKVTVYIPKKCNNYGRK